jgi:hypothetical protein
MRITSIVVCCALASLGGCRDGEESASNVGLGEQSMAVRDLPDPNMLEFRDAAEIGAYWKGENRPNFTSFDDVYKQALARLDEVETTEQHAQLLREYGDVLTLSEGTYVPTLRNPMYRKICNRDRLYASGGYLHRVVDDQNIVFTKKENARALLGVSSASGLDASIFRVANYSTTAPAPDSAGARVAASCGHTLQKDYFLNNSGCRNDRRAWVRAHAYFIISGFHYTPAAISEAWAERRTGTSCNWKHYQNVLHTKNCSFTAQVTINDTTLTFQKTASHLPSSNPYDSTSEEWEHTIWGDWGADGGPALGAPIYWGGGIPPAIEFSQIHLESSSQGVGANHSDHWAVIDCQ